MKHIQPLTKAQSEAVPTEEVLQMVFDFILELIDATGKKAGESA